MLIAGGRVGARAGVGGRCADRRARALAAVVTRARHVIIVCSALERLLRSFARVITTMTKMWATCYRYLTMYVSSSS